jgi:hypothetical protein
MRSHRRGMDQLTSTVPRCNAAESSVAVSCQLVDRQFGFPHARSVLDYLPRVRHLNLEIHCPRAAVDDLREFSSIDSLVETVQSVEK